MYWTYVNAKKVIYCPRSNLYENGICSCGDKLHGAPGWETGQICPILAVPLGHLVLWSCFVSIVIFSLLARLWSCMFKRCVGKINDLSFFLFISLFAAQVGWTLAWRRCGRMSGSGGSCWTFRVASRRRIRRRDPNPPTILPTRSGSGSGATTPWLQRSDKGTKVSLTSEQKELQIIRGSVGDPDPPRSASGSVSLK